MVYKCPCCSKAFGSKDRIHTHMKKEKECFLFLYDGYKKATYQISNVSGKVVNSLRDHNNVILGDNNKIDLSKCTNLTINYFRDAEYDFITSDQLKKIIIDSNYKIPHILTELCKQIYFNAEKPYNMSIYLNKDKNNSLIRCTYLNSDRKINQEYPKKFLTLLTDHIAELVVIHMLKSTVDIPVKQYIHIQRSLHDLITGGEMFIENKEEKQDIEIFNRYVADNNKKLLKDTVVLMKDMIYKNKDSILAKQIIEKLLEDEEKEAEQVEYVYNSADESEEPDTSSSEDDFEIDDVNTEIDGDDSDDE